MHENNIKKPSNTFRKTKIVATLGPGCNSEAILSQMIRSGMNCARFNFSHGSHKEHLTRLTMVRRMEKKLTIPIAVLLDTKGPEIRTAINAEDIEYNITRDTELIISCDAEYSTKNVIGVSYKTLYRDVKPGQIFKIADGSIILEAIKVDGTNIHCHVRDGGRLGSRKNFNVPGIKLNIEFLSNKDKEDIQFAITHQFDFIALSFVRNAEDVYSVQSILDEHQSPIKLIAKIENQEGLDNIDSILQICSGAMVARGDLAEQVQAEHIPIIQKRLIATCNKNAKIAITATQMLQSMEESPSPTRAELTDVANAIFDGTDAVMLSGETAKGNYPVEAVQTLNDISLAVENSKEFRDHSRRRFFATPSDLYEESSSAESIVSAAQIVAEKSNASVFLCPTWTGNTPRQIAKHRPTQPIFATTNNTAIYKQLLLLWGAYPSLVDTPTSDDELIGRASTMAKQRGFLKKNQKSVVVAGLPINTPMMINAIRVDFNGTLLLRARFGHGSVLQGKALHIQSPAQLEQHLADHSDPYIYIIDRLTYDYFPHLKHVKGLIVVKPPQVPLHALQKNSNQLTYLCQIDIRLASDLTDGQEIIVSGNELIAYAP